MKKILMTVSAGLFALGTAASAATLSVEDAGNQSFGSIPGGGTNNVLNGLFGVSTLDGTYGSQIVANDFGANSSVLVEVLGYEATFLNTFTAGGNSFSTPGTTAAADRILLGDPIERWTFSDIGAGGVLNFFFGTSGLSGPTAVANSTTVENGTLNTEADTEVNFFVHQDGKYTYLFFDDRGASTDDDNHDDLVVRLSAVPLPAGALLLLSGLGVLALRSRKS